MVKTSPSRAGDAGSISGLGAKIPHALQPKNQNIKQSNFVTNSIKTLKMVYIKKKYIKIFQKSVVVISHHMLSYALVSVG